MNSPGLINICPPHKATTQAGYVAIVAAALHTNKFVSDKRDDDDTMATGYRCVNYFDLCRLCTSSAGNKMEIFSEDGRKRELLKKINESLPVEVR